MNCERARLLIGAEPYVTSPELAQHLAGCSECKLFQTEMVALEADLRRALEQFPDAAAAAAAPTDGAAGAAGSIAAGADPGKPARGATPSVTALRNAREATPALGSLPTRRRKVPWSGWAVAASVLALATLSVWVFRPTNTLAHDVVAHVNHEPDSWERSTPVDAHDLQKVLGKSGVTLHVTSNDVTYARTCYLRGHFVPHLVVQTSAGPVTLLAMPDEHVRTREGFHESGYSGVIVPAEHGSIAVLAHDGGNADAAVKKLQWAIGDGG